MLIPLAWTQNPNAELLNQIVENLDVWLYQSSLSLYPLAFSYSSTSSSITRTQNEAQKLTNYERKLRLPDDFLYDPQDRKITNIRLCKKNPSLSIERGNVATPELSQMFSLSVPLCHVLKTYYVDIPLKSSLPVPSDRHTYSCCL
jgi:hypothetical protein